MSVEGRLARIEDIVEWMDKRLTSIEGRLNHIEARLEGLRGEVAKSFRWAVGLMLSILIPMWATIVLAITLR